MKPSQHASHHQAPPSTKLTEQQLLLLQQQWAQTAPRIRSDQRSNSSSVSGVQYSRISRQGYTSSPGLHLPPAPQHTAQAAAGGSRAKHSSFAGSHLDAGGPNTMHGSTPAHRAPSSPGFLYSRERSLVITPRLMADAGTEADAGDTSPVGNLRFRHTGRFGTAGGGSSPFSPFMESSYSVSSSTYSGSSTTYGPNTPVTRPSTIRTARTLSMPGQVSTPSSSASLASSRYACSNSSSSARIARHSALTATSSVSSSSTGPWTPSSSTAFQMTPPPFTAAGAGAHRPCSLADLASRSVVDSMAGLQVQDPSAQAQLSGSWVRPAAGRRPIHAGSAAGSLLGEERGSYYSVASLPAEVPQAAAAAAYNPAASWDNDYNSSSVSDTPSAAVAAKFAQQQQQQQQPGANSVGSVWPAELKVVTRAASRQPQQQHQYPTSSPRAGSCFARLLCLSVGDGGTLSPKVPRSPMKARPGSRARKMKRGRRMHGRFGKVMARWSGALPPAVSTHPAATTAAAAAEGAPSVLAVTPRKDSLTDHQPDVPRAEAQSTVSLQQQQQHQMPDIRLPLPEYVEPVAAGVGQLRATTMLYNSSASPIYRFASPGGAAAAPCYIPRGDATPGVQAGSYGTPRRHTVSNTEGVGAAVKHSSWGGSAGPAGAGAAAETAASYRVGGALQLPRRAGSSSGSAAGRPGCAVAARLQVFERQAGAGIRGGAPPLAPAASLLLRRSLSDLSQQYQLQLPRAAGTAASLSGSTAGSILGEVGCRGGPMRPPTAPVPSGRMVVQHQHRAPWVGEEGLPSGRQMQAVAGRGQLAWQRPAPTATCQGHERQHTTADCCTMLSAGPHSMQVYIARMRIHSHAGPGQGSSPVGVA